MQQEEKQFILRALYGFYRNELCGNILDFWLKRCEDKTYGGFLNCYDNSGNTLMSHDKYLWSQGRFIWLFSALAGTKSPVFSDEERKRFLELAKQGRDFVMRHALVSPGDWRCVFVTNRDGTQKAVSGEDVQDKSIYADCFVILGLSKYAEISGDREAFSFAGNLYESVRDRVKSGTFHTLPYPLSAAYRAHGIPMILNNTAQALYHAAKQLDDTLLSSLEEDIRTYASDVLEHFTDEEDALHEVITRDHQFFPQILGAHMNPGHTIEDVWFLLDAAKLLHEKKWEERIYRIARYALANGWDDTYGGLLHFCGLHGGEPGGDIKGVEDEPMVKQLAGWGDKLWWVHSEALYTTLRCYLDSGDEDFLSWHRKVYLYTFETFPNPDVSVGEWIQIRRRNGEPEDKVVALPVKDPFHIARNLLLLLERIEGEIR